MRTPACIAIWGSDHPESIVMERSAGSLPLQMGWRPATYPPWDHSAGCCDSSHMHAPWPNDRRSRRFLPSLQVDPDAPSPDNPKFRYFLHWIVANIPGVDVQRGDVIVDYMGPVNHPLI